MSTWTTNPFRRPQPTWEGAGFSFLSEPRAQGFHRRLPGYAETPLRSLPALARELGLGALLVKDEADRCSIQSFKALGASFAIYRFLQREWQTRFPDPFPADSLFCDPGALVRLGPRTFCAATDGNHGRAVAWTARMLGQKAVIYLPAGSAPARIDHLRHEGAEVVIVDGTFDDCVVRCAEDGERNGWQAVSDTAYEGYWDLPGWILLGYSTLFHELESSLFPPAAPQADVVFLPAGVGGLAAAGANFLARRYGAGRPRTLCVEPDSSAGFLESIVAGDGACHLASGRQESIMVGLNCGLPSPLAWPIVRDTVDAFLAIPDRYAEDAMRRYARPLPGDPPIESGESGSAGLAALLALRDEAGLAPLAEKLGLTPQTRVLILNTEGATDPVHYRQVVGQP